MRFRIYLEILGVIHTCYTCKLSLSLKKMFIAYSSITSTPSPARPALRKTRNSLRLEKDVKCNIKDPTQPEGN